MSAQGNISLVKRAYESFQRGDVAAVLGTMAEDVQWESPTVRNVPFSGPRRGKAAMADFFQQLGAQEEVLQFEPREFIAQGDKVVAIINYRARVKSTGQIAETPLVHVFTIKAGKVTGCAEFFDTAAAMQAYSKVATA
jgi:hypothetical protein